MSVMLVIVRLLLAAVFVVSAVAKVRDRAGSRDAVLAFGVPVSIVRPVAAGLPVVELTLAALLLAADPFATLGALGSLALLTAFTAAIIANLARGRRPTCHCFGAIGSSRAISWSTVWRNAGFLTLAALALVDSGGHPSVPGALATLGGLELAVLALTVALACSLAAVAFLRRSVERLRRRLNAIEKVTDPAGPVAPFTLPDLDGATVNLDDVLAAGRPALLVAVSPRCENCAELLPDLLAWQSDPHHSVSIVVLSDGSAADNRSKVALVGPLRVLLRDAATTLLDLGLVGTPGAVVVGPDRSRVGAPARGVDGVRRLHERAVGYLGVGRAPAPATPEHQPTAAPAAAWGAPAVRVAAGSASGQVRDARICFDGTDCGPGS